MAHINQAILATDIALFFPNYAALEPIVFASEFDFKISEHRWVGIEDRYVYV